jgi:hypothetical protein
MKTVLRFMLAVLVVGASFGMSGCTDESSRHTLTIVKINEGSSYFSDLLNEEDSLNMFIPVDEVAVELGNIPNGGGDPVSPGEPFSEIVVTSYRVTYNNGIYSPVTGGMNLRIPSGGTAIGSIALSHIADKSSLPLNTAVTSTATVRFEGYNYINGYRNGETVWAEGTVTVQVANFGDGDE